MNEFDATRFRVGNPEALGGREKDLWVKVEPLIHQLLVELKKSGKIETVFLPADMNLLDATLKKLNEFSKVHNVFINLFDSESDSKGFLAVNAKFGLDEPNTISAYLISALAVSMLSTELFKLLLLFLTKDVDPSVANFPKTMRREAPNSWELLEPFVDTPWRNAIAHGTYAIINRKFRLFKNAKLEADETEEGEEFAGLDLSDFMMRIKDKNVLFQVLVNVIVDLAAAGFFQPSV